MLVDPDHPSRRRVLPDSLWKPTTRRSRFWTITPIAWSPDGSSLLLTRGRGWFVVSDTGTVETTVHVRGPISGASFTPDGSAVIYQQNGSVYREPLGGSGRVRITGATSQAGRFVNVAGGSLSPDGSTIVYPRAGAGGGGGAFWLIDGDGSHTRRLVTYRRAASLVAARRNDGISMLSWLPGGRLLLISSDEKVVRCHMFTIDRDGTDLRLWGPPGLCAWSAELSPDGSRIALVRGKARPGRIMIFNTDGTRATVVPWKDASVGLDSLPTVWRP